MRLTRLRATGIAVFVIAGCGGSQHDAGLSHAALVRQGNAICATASGKIDALGDPATLADIARIGGRLATIRDTEATSLAALRPSAADAAGHARMLRALKQRNATLHEVVRAARSGDQAAASKALAAGQPPGDRASDAALELGLERCAAGG